MAHVYDCSHLILLHHETPSLFTDCGSCCSEKLQLCLAMVAALVLFPLLVWGGYALLPFDAPVLKSTPLRLVYTLRCAFFATVPIILGKTSRSVCCRSFFFTSAPPLSSTCKVTFVVICTVNITCVVPRSSVYDTNYGGRK